MAEQQPITTMDQAMRRIKELENQEGVFVKTGEIVILNNPESPSENFTKITIGIDASQFINGKEIKDYFPATISKFNKELFAKFDQTGTPEFRKGDIVKVMCDAISFQISEETFPKASQTKRPAIFANNNLVKCVMVQKGTGSSEPAKTEVTEKPEIVPDGFEWDEATKKLVEKAPF
jgi:hypothetical protein